jgi:PD-(D/E)XK nuclease superfamily
MQKLDYKTTFAISQSAIKLFNKKTIQKFKKIFIDKEEDDDEDESKFDFGSLCDTLLFEPDLLEERFFFPDENVTFKEPSAVIKQILDRTHKEGRKIVEDKRALNENGNLPERLYVESLGDLGDFLKIAVKHAREIKYGGKTWSDERIIDNLYEYRDYFYFLSVSLDRRVISSKDYNDALDVVSVVKSHPLTKDYFTQKEGETLLFQQDIYVNEGFSIALKGIPDIIRIIHENETYIVPDFKSTYSGENFPEVARKLGYGIQASFYAYLVKEFLKTYEDGKYAHYNPLPPINIAIDKNYKVPYIYEYSWQDLELLQYGSKERNIRGWIDVIDDICWHFENDVWNMPKELFEKGKIVLKLFKS